LTFTYLPIRWTTPHGFFFYRESTLVQYRRADNEQYACHQFPNCDRSSGLYRGARSFFISIRELDDPGPIRLRFLAPNFAAGPFPAVWRFHHTRCDSHSRRRRVEAIYHTAYRDRNGMEFQLRLPVKKRRGLAEPECLRNQHSCN
jgi:hypothetical protein